MSEIHKMWNNNINNHLDNYVHKQSLKIDRQLHSNEDAVIKLM